MALLKHNSASNSWLFNIRALLLKAPPFHSRDLSIDAWNWSYMQTVLTAMRLVEVCKVYRILLSRDERVSWRDWVYLPQGSAGSWELNPTLMVLSCSYTSISLPSVFLHDFKDTRVSMVQSLIVEARLFGRVASVRKRGLLIKPHRCIEFLARR